MSHALIGFHRVQVAAHSQHHLCVRKAVSPDGRMLTVIEHLAERSAREAEIAAMLGLGLPAAQQMLREAEQTAA